MDKTVAATIVEATLSMVPVAGGPLTAVWAAVVGAAYEKRREQWQREITEAVQDLLDQVDELTPESLAANPDFLDALVHATMTATATGQQEKLAALRNAVLNSALPSDLDSDSQAMFLRYVRDFTPSHLRLLKLLDDPQTWFAEHGIPWPDMMMGGAVGKVVVEGGMPEMAGQSELYNRLFTDLQAAGLTINGGIGGPMLGTTMTGQGLTQQRTTETGRAFLRFITDPRQP